MTFITLASTPKAFHQATGAWQARRVVISAAQAIDLSHLGVHTHENYLVFRVKNPILAALFGPAGAKTSRDAQVVPRCRYSTDHADMPPGYHWLAQDLGGIPSLGPIDGDPGWSLAQRTVRNGIVTFRFSAPTRFANWVAHQPESIRRRYENRRSYSLEIRWLSRES